MIPWVALADGLPTPLERPQPGLWLKRDDLTSSVYGGNKVRKLEFALAAPARRGNVVVTAGARGSHHVTAVAVHGASLGIRTEAVVYDVDAADDLDSWRERLDALGTKIERVGSEFAMPLALARAAARPDRHVIMPGASTPLGTLGYVNAGIELAAQLPPSVETVVVPYGSGGTAVGLALGLAAASHPARVVAPVVSSRLVANRVQAATLEAGTRVTLALAGIRPGRVKLTVDSSTASAGYGQPTEDGERAAARAIDLGFAVERTYTAKALATAFAEVDAGRETCFVQTWAQGGLGGHGRRQADRSPQSGEATGSRSPRPSNP